MRGTEIGHAGRRGRGRGWVVAVIGGGEEGVVMVVDWGVE